MTGKFSDLKFWINKKSVILADGDKRIIIDKHGARHQKKYLGCGWHNTGDWIRDNLERTLMWFMFEKITDDKADRENSK